MSDGLKMFLVMYGLFGVGILIIRKGWMKL